MKVPLPAVAVAIRFIDCVNQNDLNGLAATMSDDHRLAVFDEQPVIGRRANTAAWRGYFESFPDYVIHPRRIEVTGNSVAVLGHTTGSHLALPDDEESQQTLIWVAQTDSGRVRVWRLVEDTPSNRSRYSLT